MSNLPATTPIADLVRWAKMRWRIEHDYRELKHGLGLDHFEGRTWRGWHHHVTLVTAARAFLTLRRLGPPRRRPDPLPGPRHAPRPAEVLDRHLYHLRSNPANQQK
ncbi:transposase [Streptomyces sp. MMS24-I2-30]|uniref:transposase n=1 Tax=Streptomyces sp. MMS24-I2-30 TaxID=3351564 RepID=UPI003896EAB7